jgi:hypothetical protein
MGLILDLIGSGETALWSITTEADTFDFYVLPDYIAKPIDWSIDWGRPWRDDRTTEIIPSFFSAHPSESREESGGYYSSVDGEEFYINYMVERWFIDLDTIPLEITGTANLVTTGFHSFTDLLFTLVPVGYNQAFEHTVVIDWGDGTTTTDTPTPIDYDTFTAGEHTPYTYAHSYDEPGTYTLSFTITAPVREIDPTDYLDLFCVIHPIPSSFTYGLTVDWGDGNQDSFSDTTDGRGSGDGGELAVGHVYDSPGPHTATITATQGRWVPYFPFGAGDISALGPMNCGFRLGCDLYYSFHELGGRVHDGCLTSPHLHFENAVFMGYAFEDSKLRYNSDQFPFAPDFPAYSLSNLRWGYNIFYSNITYLPLSTIQSFHQPSLFQAYAYGYEQAFNVYDVIEALGPSNYDGAPDGVCDALFQFVDAQDYSDGSLYAYSKFTTLAGYQAFLSLQDKNWDSTSATEVWLGFFLKNLWSYDSGSRAYLPDRYDRGLWFEEIEGGLRIKFTIYREPYLNPENPEQATVTWAITRIRYTEYLAPSYYWGSIQNWTTTTDIVAGDTESFGPSETSKIITCDLLDPYYAWQAFESPVYDYYALTLDDSTSESLSPGGFNWYLLRATPAGPTTSYNQKGFFGIQGSSTTTPTGLRFRITIGRYPDLNPSNPGSASVDWQLERTDCNIIQLWASITWSVVDTGTLSFDPDEHEQTFDIDYDDPVTYPPNFYPYSTPATQFRLVLVNPVNETMGFGRIDYLPF